MDTSFEKRLFNIENKLDKVGDAISKIAVQKGRIDSIEEKVNAILLKWDKLVDPEEGMLPRLKAKTATYDSKIKALRWVIGLLGATSVGSTTALFALTYHIWKFTG